MNPLISILIPTYNRELPLRRAVQSVLAQTYDNWELLVVDDGSTDATESVIRDFQDERIVYHHKKNEGPHIARNFGMEHSRGELLAYLDSDNVLYPTYLERMLASFAADKEIVWGFPMGERIKELYRDGVLIKKVDDSGDFPGTVTVQDIFHRKLHTDTTGAMHTRQVVEHGIRWDPAIPKMEDWDFFLTLADTYPDGFVYVQEILYTYTQRFGGDGIVSNSTYEEWAHHFEKIYQKHKASPLMKGQTWYPDRVDKWHKLARDFEAGLLPPYHEYYFR